MKKVGIITINDNDNYGNRLQNYAVQEFLKKLEIEAITVKNTPIINTKNKYILRYIKNLLMIVKKTFNNKKDSKLLKRKSYFEEFNKNIVFSKKTITPYSNIKEYDYFITGSDQVWNPNFNRLREVDLLEFVDPQKRISFSSSFGISTLPIQYNEKLKNALKDYKAISVREEAGKKIVENVVGRNNVEVLVDPTMLLTPEEWDKVSKKPEQLKSNKKYILNYFLGNLSDKRKAEIERIAKENDCEIINILDKNDPFYETGPSEFLYLEKHAFLICTDSFHSSVFAILYNKPFVVFEREGNGANMNSRIDTLLTKFKLKNRTFNEKITKENLEHDYSQAYEILEIEREKSKKFLEKALDIERTNNE